jgi:6-hydroxycyclohex-1-ene-1-carbonyl-CoA dehydrogenase
VTIKIERWQMVAPGEAMEAMTTEFEPSTLTPDQILVQVAGCGVCHTDLGFLYDGVNPRHALPLTLGHEISGRVVAAGADAQDLLNRAVVVPAVLPCGACDACKRGRGAICPKQFFPGNDDHGGFASHVVVPSLGVCVVDEEQLVASDVDLASLAVIADAVTTPYQAILNAELRAGDVAIFIGAGGVGTFGVQLAHEAGAHVVAIDVDATRLEQLQGFGVDLAILSTGDIRSIKKKVRSWVNQKGLPQAGWKIFETSGHPAGQELAYALLTYDAHLAVVGYTREKVNLRLSNLMAFDATARGTWGCLPEHYPAVVDLVLRGKVALAPFIETRSMGRLNETFEALRAHSLKKRPVMIP